MSSLAISAIVFACICGGMLVGMILRAILPEKHLSAEKNDAQRAPQAQALKTATELAQQRWLLFAQKGSSIPTPLLVVMVSWLTLFSPALAYLRPQIQRSFSRCWFVPWRSQVRYFWSLRWTVRSMA